MNYFHNNRPEITAYCSLNMSLSDFQTLYVSDTLNLTHTSIKISRRHYQGVEDCLYLGHQVGDRVLLLLAGCQVSVPLEEGGMEGLLHATLRGPDRGEGGLSQHDVERDVGDERGPCLHTGAPTPSS